MYAKEKLIELASELKVYNVCKRLLDDKRFWLCPASSKPEKHHHYTGGLADHTLEVVELCLNSYYIEKYKINRKNAYLAALYHDYGKIYDYIETESGWGVTKHKYFVGHIVTSTTMLSKEVEGKISYEDYYQISHAILAHHGRNEYGSPVTPQTPLAWLLHLSDNFSARMNDMYTYHA